MGTVVEVWHLVVSVGTVVVGMLVFVWRISSKAALLQNEVSYLKRANEKRKTEIETLEMDIHSSLGKIKEAIERNHKVIFNALLKAKLIDQID